VTTQKCQAILGTVQSVLNINGRLLVSVGHLKVRNLFNVSRALIPQVEIEEVGKVEDFILVRDIFSYLSQNIHVHEVMVMFLNIFTLCLNTLVVIFFLTKTFIIKTVYEMITD